MLVEIVKAQANIAAMYPDGETYSEAEILEAVAKIQTRHDTSMGLGAVFDSEDYTPWLDKRKDINYYYWERYEKLLKKKLSEDIVTKTDTITNKILDRLEDPRKDGAWERRGLVVGHVQSGKTANYIGVMCKAADAGYKVIIVLGGLLNSLRNQTQKRIDSDFLGYCTKKKKEFGVALFDNSRRPFSLTTSVDDFKKATANTVTFSCIAVPLAVILSLWFAVLLERNIPGNSILFQYYKIVFW
jgi:ABC-type sugar transport system permease subunit